LDKHAKILIVDDDETVRSTMKIILEDEGYLVDFADCGVEAIQKTREKLYNIAFLDIRLPDMEGIELLQRIKDGVPRTRKIMLTGYPSMQNAIAALNKNADAYLVKPVNIESLLSTVKKQLQLQNDEKEFSEEKVAEFIETRVKELEMNPV
jgi:two-component system nitrogen regulation response regulator NtrX